MTREEYLIKARREARGRGGKGEAGGKKSFAKVMAVQLLVCIIAYGGVMSVKNIDSVNYRLKYYLNYTVDYKESVDGIIKACQNYFKVKPDA